MTSLANLTSAAERCGFQKPEENRKPELVHSLPIKPFKKRKKKASLSQYFDFPSMPVAFSLKTICCY